MEQNTIQQLVAQLAEKMNINNSPIETPVASSAAPVAPVATPSAGGATLKFTVADYPLLQKHPEVVKSPTNKSVSEITLDAVVRGEVENADVRISRQMLLNQADVAESAGKVQVAQNLRRASELTEVPDDVVIKMYDMMRPNRATKAQLLEIAATLRNSYHAPLCAKLVEEACEVYENRGILLK